MQSNTKKKIAPVLITILALLFAGPQFASLVYFAAGLAGSDAGGFSLVLLPFAAIFGAVTVGILLALGQRLREIDGEEEEDAKKY